MCNSVLLPGSRETWRTDGATSVGPEGGAQPTRPASTAARRRVSPTAVRNSAIGAASRLRPALGRHSAPSNGSTGITLPGGHHVRASVLSLGSAVRRRAWPDRDTAPGRPSLTSCQPPHSSRPASPPAGQRRTTATGVLRRTSESVILRARSGPVFTQTWMDLVLAPELAGMELSPGTTLDGAM